MSPVVIAYHAIGSCDDDPHALYVTEAAFEAQMRVLARGRAPVVPLTDIVRGTAPRRSVAITFDDAYVSVLRFAAPVLARHGFPATVFVPAGWLGRTAGWVPASDCDFSIMTAEELREVERLGVTVESHGSRHIDMAKADYETALADLRASLDDLEAVVGRRPRLLAWPFGPSSLEARRAAEELQFEAAFAIDAPTDGRLAWERVGITPPDNLTTFRVKCSGFYLRLRYGRAGATGWRLVRRLFPRNWRRA